MRTTKAAPPARSKSRSPETDRYATALARLVENLKEDRSVIAALLCGSLSHDTVWAKSDIDLLIVTADEKSDRPPFVALDADGIAVHAEVTTRTAFRRSAEGARHNSFVHSYVAKGRLLFTHDPTIEALVERLQVVGDGDTKVQLLSAAVMALYCLDKARKWLVTRGDLNYTALWILYAATPLARLEIVGRKLIAGREVIPQAAQLNPDFFRTIYTDLLNAKKTIAPVTQALELAERYIRDRAPDLFALVLDHLSEAGEARSCSELDDYFKRHYDVEAVVPACEYLAAEGLIGKASLPLRLTKRSTAHVQELAFFAVEAGSRQR
jgi:predicted nucleotidyltransferase